MTEDWFTLHHPDLVPTPGIVFYQDRIRRNIAIMVAIAGSPERLIPHTKTHKTIEILKLQLEVGITKFKVSTIAEAEMAAMAGAPWVLLAYPVVGPNVARWHQLMQQYPETSFQALVDNPITAHAIHTYFEEEKAPVFIDVNNGMDRTGVEVENLQSLINYVHTLPNLELKGLHIYDGHIRNTDFEERKEVVDAAYQRVIDAIQVDENWMIIAGGTPSFTVHALRTGTYLSPGTCLLWDWGYDDLLEEQPFEWAALLVTRVVSKPAEGLITIDLGHKSVAAENPVNRRVKFLNLAEYELLSQSEEHGVVRVSSWESIEVGDLLYGVPYHICPTVALHETATVVENGEVVDEWAIVSRKRKITI